MKRTTVRLITLALAASITAAVAQDGSAESIRRPTRSRPASAPLEYKDGAPSKETVAKTYDYLDLMHGVEAFVNAYQGASVAALFKGFEDAGVPDNTALIWSELMDAKSVFLTPNADTIYFWVNLNVTKGPLVDRDAADVARRHRRHLVPLGDRLRPARSRPRRGRALPAGAARLQGRTAGERVLRVQTAHDPRDGVWAGPSSRTMTPSLPWR